MLIDFKQIKSGKNMLEDINLLKESYEAYKVMTSIQKENVEEFYNVDELLGNIIEALGNITPIILDEYFIECNATDTEYIVNHNQNKEAKLLQLYEVDTNEQVFTSINVIDNNNVKIEFGKPYDGEVFKLVAIF